MANILRQIKNETNAQAKQAELDRKARTTKIKDSREILRAGFRYLSEAAVVTLQRIDATIEFSDTWQNHVIFPEGTTCERNDPFYTISVPCGCSFCYTDKALMRANYSSQVDLILYVGEFCDQHNDRSDGLQTYHHQ